MKNNLKKYAEIKLIISIFNKVISIFNKIKHIKISNFQIIFLVYALIFSIFLFLSFPSIFDFNKNYKEQILKKTYSNFKIHLSNVSEIKYRFVPTPHILIKSTDIKLNKEEKEISTIKNLKLFISILELYKEKKILIHKLQIDKANIYFDRTSLNTFNKHLNDKVIKPIKIKNSNFFYKDKNGKIVTISPIKKINYYIDFASKEKKLNIIGKLFDLNFNFFWNKNYNNPNLTNLLINFKNPNIRIENKQNQLFENNSEGLFRLAFIGNNVDVKYNYDGEILNFKTLSSKNSKYYLEGKTNTNPFYFEIDSEIKNLDLDFVINYLLLNYYKYENAIHKNINGTFSIKFSDMRQSILKNGLINLNLKDSKIKIKNSNFDIKKVGNISFSNGLFDIRENNLFYTADARLEIKDQKEFYRLFVVSRENRINLKNIKFHLEKNLDKKQYTISKIYFNNIKKQGEQEFDNSVKYNFKNIQQLRGIIRDSFESIN